VDAPVHGHAHLLGDQVDHQEGLEEEQLVQIEETLHHQNQDHQLAGEDTHQHRRDLLHRQIKQIFFFDVQFQMDFVRFLCYMTEL